MLIKSIVLLAVIASIASAQRTFTYQGTLEDDGAPANGFYDMRFTLWDDPSPGPPDTQFGSTVVTAPYVTDGLFKVELNMTDETFQTLQSLYLQIEVRLLGDPTYTILSRQRVNYAPRALYALKAVTFDLPLNGSGPPLTSGGATFQITNTATGVGIRGEGSSSGVLGISNHPPDGYPGYLLGTGVAGISSIAGIHGTSDNGYGVAGWSSNGTGGYFQTRGNLPNQYALRAESTFGSTAGLFEVNDFSSNLGLPALIAKTSSIQNNAFAIHSIIESTSPGGFSTALRGENRGTGPFGIGVWGSHDGSGWGVYGTTGPGGLAGRFEGDVAVVGLLSKSGGSFKIDHPQDPENMYLSHSFVESPDMKNIYDGVVILDKSGQALVTLPSYFNALNRDFRYQLTTIGGYAPVYIATEIQNGQFAIAGGTPGLKVSWQVTGIRHDAWANQNRIPTEEYKEPQNQGKYLNPESFGQPRENGIGYIESASQN